MRKLLLLDADVIIDFYFYEGSARLSQIDPIDTLSLEQETEGLLKEILS